MRSLSSDDVDTNRGRNVSMHTHFDFVLTGLAQWTVCHTHFGALDFNAFGSRGFDKLADQAGEWGGLLKGVGKAVGGGDEPVENQHAWAPPEAANALVATVAPQDKPKKLTDEEREARKKKRQQARKQKKKKSE